MRINESVDGRGSNGGESALGIIFFSARYVYTKHILRCVLTFRIMITLDNIRIFRASEILRLKTVSLYQF